MGPEREGEVCRLRFRDAMKHRTERGHVVRHAELEDLQGHRLVDGTVHGEEGEVEVHQDNPITGLRQFECNSTEAVETERRWKASRGDWWRVRTVLRETDGQTLEVRASRKEVCDVGVAIWSVDVREAQMGKMRKGVLGDKRYVLQHHMPR